MAGRSWVVVVALRLEAADEGRQRGIGLAVFPLGTQAEQDRRMMVTCCQWCWWWWWTASCGCCCWCGVGCGGLGGSTREGRTRRGQHHRSRRWTPVKTHVLLLVHVSSLVPGGMVALGSVGGAESRASVCGSDDPRRHLQPLTGAGGSWLECSSCRTTTSRLEKKVGLTANGWSCCCCFGYHRAGGGRRMRDVASMPSPTHDSSVTLVDISPWRSEQVACLRVCPCVCKRPRCDNAPTIIYAASVV